jgi:hypothetical protein
MLVAASVHPENVAIADSFFVFIPEREREKERGES